MIMRTNVTSSNLQLFWTKFSDLETSEKIKRFLQRRINSRLSCKLLVVKTGNLGKFSKFFQSHGQNVIKCALLGSFLAIYRIKDSTTKHYRRNLQANSSLSKLFNAYFL